jgi:molybdate transport system regulatory protein
VAVAKPDLSLRIRVIRGADIVIGPGRADLLGHIDNTGSIAAAGRQMNMSYKRAWELVEAMNNVFAHPLVEAVKGGAGGGGARLTATGHAVLAAYRSLQAEAAAAAAPALDRLAAALSVPPGGKTG